MGQYHKIVSAAAKEYLSPHQLDCGLKMGEQAYSRRRVDAALSLLLSYNPTQSNEPGDIYQVGLTGRWAGHRILGVGDYAMDGDYDAATGKSWKETFPELPPESQLYERLYPKDDENDGYESPPEFLDAAAWCWSAIEAATEVRVVSQSVNYRRQVIDLCMNPPIGQYTDSESGAYTSISFIPVVRAVRGWAINGNEHFRSYWQSLEPEAYDRDPRGGIIAPDEFGIGQDRIILNLDKGEYLDPVRIDEVNRATTAMLMRGLDVTTVLMMMLFHPEMRGGGDLSSRIGGRWRGDRIVMTAERPGEFPTTEMVRSGDYDDISGLPGIREILDA